MKSKIIITTVGILASASLVTILPALAQTTTASNGAKMSSTTRQIHLEARLASSSEARIVKMQNRGDQEIDNRVDSLTKILGRIEEMKKVPDSQKSAYTSTIHSEIGALTDLKTKIDSETGTTTKADVQSITKAYRVYALIMPRLSISAAADRIETIADMLATTSAKLQTRLASTTLISTSTDLTALQASLTDMNAKIADARVQAKTAVDEVTALQPDNGDQTVMKSNTSTLKDARAKIQAAQKDLIAARKDAQLVANALKKDRKENKSERNSTSTKATSTRE